MPHHVRPLLIALLAVTTFARAQPATQPSTLLPEGGVAAMAFSAGPDGQAVRDVVVAEGQAFEQAVRVATRVKPATTYAVQLRALTSAPVAAGDVVQIGFHARSIEAQAETGEATTEIVFERAGGDYAKSVEHPVAVGPKWQRYDVTFRAGNDLPAGEAQLTFRLGYAPQVVEIGGVEAINHGRHADLKKLPGNVADYAGRAPDAPWRAAAAQRIEQHRKADLNVVVTDAAGNPVEGAKVEVRMKRHAFGFGTAVAAQAITAEDPDGDAYRRTLKDNFNKVVTENDLKWPNWENLTNRPRTMKALQWLNDNNFAVRGHVLVWPGWASKMNPTWKYLPEDLRDLVKDPPALRKRINDHITETVTATAGLIAEWDVINETWSNYALMEVLGNEAMIEWFKVARQAADAAGRPDMKLYYNDYTMLSGGAKDPARIDHYYNTVKYLIDNKAPIDGIGEQAHFGQTMAPPQRMLDILDRFATFGLPIQITEFDINTTDEALQADYTRDFYTVAFSHPSVNGIIMWGFWEGRHWMPNAAMFRKDWSPKPNAKAYRDLVYGQWWTSADGVTAADGRFATRGFLGDYEITVTAPGRPAKTTGVRLTKDAAAVSIQVGP